MHCPRLSPTLGTAALLALTTLPVTAVLAAEGSAPIDGNDLAALLDETDALAGKLQCIVPRADPLR